VAVPTPAPSYLVARLGRMAGRGRPTKLTPILADDLVLLLAAGASTARAARCVGVSERSVTRWLRDGLAERVRLARASGPEATDALTEARMVVALARAAALGDWRAGAWMLERRWPERWADRDSAARSVRPT
jgi:transposase